MVPIDFSYIQAVNSNFCSRTFRLATIHSVQTDDRQTQHCSILTNYRDVSKLQGQVTESITAVQYNKQGLMQRELCKEWPNAHFPSTGNATPQRAIPDGQRFCQHPAQSERQFSAAGRLISKPCLWLDPKRVDTLIFLCKNMLQADLSSNYHLLVGPSV